MMISVVIVFLNGGCTSMKSAQYQYSDGSGNTYKMGYSGKIHLNMYR